MRTFRHEERRVDETGREYGHAAYWINAPTASESLAGYRARHGAPIDVREFAGATSKRRMEVFFVENGNNPYKLYIEVYLDESNLDRDVVEARQREASKARAASLKKSIANSRRKLAEDESMRIEDDPIDALDRSLDNLDDVIDALREKGFPKQANIISKLGARIYEIADTCLEG